MTTDDTTGWAALHARGARYEAMACDSTRSTGDGSPSARQLALQCYLAARREAAADDDLLGFRLAARCAERVE